MNLNINDFGYTLPADRIARYPLADRDESKLLSYGKGKISHHKFYQLPDLLPQNSMLFFNNTKVIPARLHFHKSTGAVIELFLLNPLQPSSIMAEVMQARKHCTWRCTIGNLKRWTAGQKLTKPTGAFTLEANLVDRQESVVEFTWDGNLSFAEIITSSGMTPLPPYLKREAEDTDKVRYQTIYSQHEGAVAAPTAGLHFTDRVMRVLKEKGIETDFLTLHVSAGTFQPVKTENAIDHTMHSEQVVISKKNIDNLLRDQKFIIPVGTTSMRTLESLYWYGVKLLKNEYAEFVIEQRDPYNNAANLPGKKEALLAIAAKMKNENVELLTGSSSIYIHPGYQFKISNGMVTNFHQPGSTLILLIAAFIGSSWRNVYEEALRENYRFLSYGDSSLLIP